MTVVTCPNCRRPAPGGLFGFSNDAELADGSGEARWTVLHCGCYHNPHGGERFTSIRDEDDRRYFAELRSRKR